MATQRELDEALTDAKAAHADIAKAQTADEIRQVFQGFYQKLGHKVIARMLLGQTPERAMRLNGRNGG